MRILIAVHGYPPAHSAGAERLAERMAHWLLASGHHVEVFTLEQLADSHPRVETSVQDNVKIHRTYYEMSDTPDDELEVTYNHPQITTAFESVLTQGQFDLVHLISGYLISGSVIHTAYRLQIPIILTITEYWFMCARLNLIQSDNSLCSGPTSAYKCVRCLMESKRRYRLPARFAPHLMDSYWQIADHLSLYEPLTEAVIKRQKNMLESLEMVDVVICPSQFIVSKFTEMGFDTSRFAVIRHGLAVLPQTQPRTETTSPQLRLGFIGQIKYHKGVDILVDAVISLLNSGKPVTLDLWGPETEEEDYVNKLKKLTVPYSAIRWNGPYVGSKVWDILQTFDALVVPSRWYENSPIVINEANHMKLPVISTNLGGMAEMVKHNQTGMVFELNNVEDLRLQIERLLDDPSLLKKFRANIPCTRTIDQEMEQVVEQYTKVLHLRARQTLA